MTNSGSPTIFLHGLETLGGHREELACLQGWGPSLGRRNSDTEQLVGPLTSFIGLDSEVSPIAMICPVDWRELGGKLGNNMGSRRAGSAQIPESPAVNMELCSALNLQL